MKKVEKSLLFQSLDRIIYSKNIYEFLVNKDPDYGNVILAIFTEKNLTLYQVFSNIFLDYNI